MKIIAAILSMLISTAIHATGKPEFPNGHDNRPEKQSKPVKTTTQSVEVKQSARSEARAQAGASASSSSLATGGAGTGGTASGGTAIGGNSYAAGGSANAYGGQVIVSNGGNVGNGSGLSGRIVPDVSASSPITSVSCRNGITAGGSGNGWGGLLGFFSEDDLCEWRLLEQNYRSTGDHDKANAIRSGMTAQRCEKLSNKDREMFGDLCPNSAPAESQNVAFSSAG